MEGPQTWTNILGRTLRREVNQFNALPGLVRGESWECSEHNRYLLTESAVGTGGGHFESLDWPLKVEAALMP
jgi:hypothetical protein